MQVRLDELKATTLNVLRLSGYSQEHAEIILDVLMYAQLRGNNQGIVKLIGAGMPADVNATAIKVLHETKLSALIDGGRNQGMVAMHRALEMALEKAREHGFGIVGTNNTTTSTGAIGYFASKAAQAGFIAFVFSGSPEYVAMHGSYEPIFGTNPLAIGVPSSEKPLVFDMATAAIARFGVIEAKTAGRSIPADVAYDAEGQPTTDPAAALAGAIRTFGGYKGAALSMMVEVLTRPLVHTTPNAEGRKTDGGNLVLAFDPGLMGDAEAFKREVASLAKKVKATRRLPGVEEILVPGERGDRVLDAITASGVVEVEDNLWKALQAKAV
jgi:LDH2 family malate/lactate/ureidoglycolate dehydrogenase